MGWNPTILSLLRSSRVYERKSAEVSFVSHAYRRFNLSSSEPILFSAESGVEGVKFEIVRRLLSSCVAIRLVNVIVSLLDDYWNIVCLTLR